jgi:D-hydroxyproline dehydrogenase subunit gamma
MPEGIEVTVNGRAVRVAAGTSAVAAIALAGLAACRTSATGEPRGPLCGMGICFECRASVDGEAHVRTCQVVCKQGMVIATDAA